MPQGSACVRPTFASFLQYFAQLQHGESWNVNIPSRESAACITRYCTAPATAKVVHENLFQESRQKSSEYVLGESHVGPKLGFAAPSSDFWKFLCAAVKKSNLVTFWPPKTCIELVLPRPELDLLLSLHPDPQVCPAK